MTPKEKAMKTENGYHIDKNGNKWTESIYTLEQAIKFSDTLIDCKNCVNCRSCSYCSYCSYCRSCSYCSDCSDCRSCSYCSYCRSCSYCSDCSDCRSCSYCSYCSYCSDFISNPQRIVSPILGSRKSQTTIYWCEGKNKVVCGCFKGTIEDFKLKINETHGENQYAKEYNKWLDKVIQYIF